MIARAPLVALAVTVAVASVAVVTAAVTAADAQQPRCAPRAQVLELVERQFRETRRAIGLSANDTVMELFASEARGTWTLVVTLPNGLSCLVAAGTDFEATAAPAAGAPA